MHYGPPDPAIAQTRGVPRIFVGVHDTQVVAGCSGGVGVAWREDVARHYGREWTRVALLVARYGCV